MTLCTLITLFVGMGSALLGYLFAQYQYLPKVKPLKKELSEFKTAFENLKNKSSSIFKDYAFLKGNFVELDSNYLALKAQLSNREQKYNDLKVNHEILSQNAEALVAEVDKSKGVITGWEVRYKSLEDDHAQMLKDKIKLSNQIYELNTDFQNMESKYQKKLEEWVKKYQLLKTQFNEKPKEIIKEIKVPVEVIKEVEVLKEVKVPIEVVREVQVIKEVPVEIIKEVEIIKSIDFKKPKDLNLNRASGEDFKEILDNPDSEKEANIVERREASPTNKASKNRRKPGNRSNIKNDLKKIEGIGPMIEKVLNKVGITTWGQLAKTRVNHLRKILENEGKQYHMHDPASWPKQAKLAANGKWNELEDWQNQLNGGKVKRGKF